MSRYFKYAMLLITLIVLIYIIIIVFGSVWSPFIAWGREIFKRTAFLAPT